MPKRPESTDEYREALIGNLEQVEKLIALARSLLTLTKVTGDRPPLQLAPLELEPLLQELIIELKPLADDRRISPASMWCPCPRFRRTRSG
ncbi:MAG: hypothetical protein IPO99_20560 [Nitrospira sp.]|nr:hypothetical protein [Nitrospira sp.]